MHSTIYGIKTLFMINTISTFTRMGNVIKLIEYDKESGVCLKIKEHTPDKNN